MSFYQRLINKYIYTGLNKQYSLKSYFHFLVLTKEDSTAKVMLKENINQLLKGCTNSIIFEQFEKLLEERTTKYQYGDFVTFKKEKQDFRTSQSNKKPRYIDRANNYLSNFYLENAFKYYEKDTLVNHNSHNSEFALIYLLRENYFMAYQFASKIDNIEIMFLSAVCLSNFSLADQFLNRIVDLLSSTQPIFQLISRYELFQLCCYITLATKSAFEISSFYEKISGKLDITIDLLNNLINAMKERNYEFILQMFDSIRETLTYSIYTSQNSSSFLDAIKGNIIANLVEPFSRLPFQVIYEQTFSTREEVISHLIQQISEGKINGKLDLINDQYIGLGNLSDETEMKEILYHTMAVKDKLNRVCFQNDFNLLHSSKQRSKSNRPQKSDEN